MTHVELADTSAWTWQRRDPSLADEFTERLRWGGIATCRAVVLELLWEARDLAEIQQLREGLESLRDFPIRRREWDRAADVMHALLERGPLHHRSVKLPDLLIAAAAESAEVPVLHYDRHFERIAEVTGQPMRALAPLGSL
ncbi:MAG TPA: PIN domain-containing protein [Gaiellaceae bacterium]|nr:PIN domain-containing protein [Gaiellaceae bacterium]